MEHGAIVNLISLGCFKQVAEHFSLFSKAVDDVFASVCYRGLKEEGEIAQDRSHFFAIDGNSAEELCEEDHVDHKGNGEQGVLADVVGGDGVDAAEEDSRGVLVESSFGVADEGHVLDDDHVVEVVSVGVQRLVGHDLVVQTPRLGLFL